MRLEQTGKEMTDERAKAADERTKAAAQHEALRSKLEHERAKGLEQRMQLEHTGKEMSNERAKAADERTKAAAQHEALRSKLERTHTELQRVITAAAVEEALADVKSAAQEQLQRQVEQLQNSNSSKPHSL
jgi:hypothetical protein